MKLTTTLKSLLTEIASIESIASAIRESKFVSFIMMGMNLVEKIEVN
jgi:hypothetical protein